MPYIIKKLQYNSNNKSNIYSKTLHSITTEIELLQKKILKSQNYTVREINISNIKTSLIHSHYTMDEVKRDIIENKYTAFEIKANIERRRINIQLLSISKIIDNEMIMKILSILKLLIPFSQTKCSKTLNITIVLSEHKKHLPHSEHIVIGPKHVNSGVSYSCALNGDILIYRKEEWFKVLIHELFHSLGLDFNYIHNDKLVSNMQKRFCVRSEFLLFEAYTEFWANILHTCYVYVERKRKTGDLNISLQNMIENEIKFSMFQLIKILWFMNTNYKTIVNPKMCSNILLYKEDTNVFSYYILKTVLLYNYREFINWCLRNNKNIFQFNHAPISFHNFDKFIEKIYKTKTMMNDINENEKIIKTMIKNGVIKRETLNQLKMTYYG